MANDPRDDEIQELRDALDHIERVARASRTQSQRDRWIAFRAHCALTGSDAWKDDDPPRMAQGKSRIERIVMRHMNALNEKTPDEQRREVINEMVADLRRAIQKGDLQ